MAAILTAKLRYEHAMAYVDFADFNNLVRLVAVFGIDFDDLHRLQNEIDAVGFVFAELCKFIVFDDAQISARRQRREFWFFVAWLLLKPR